MVKKLTRGKQLPWAIIALVSLLLALIGAPLGIFFALIFLVSLTIWSVHPFLELARKEREIGLDFLPHIFGLLAIVSMVIVILMPFLKGAICGNVSEFPYVESCWSEGDKSYCNKSTDVCIYSQIQQYLLMFVMVDSLLLLISGILLGIKKLADGYHT